MLIEMANYSPNYYVISLSNTSPTSLLCEQNGLLSVSTPMSLTPSVIGSISSPLYLWSFINMNSQQQMILGVNEVFICVSNTSPTPYLSTTNCSSQFLVQFSSVWNCSNVTVSSTLQYVSDSSDPQQYLSVNSTNNVVLSTTPYTFYFTPYAGNGVANTSYSLVSCDEINNIYVQWNYQFCGNVANNFGGIAYNYYGTNFPNPPVVQNSGMYIPIYTSEESPPSSLCSYIQYNSGNPTCPNVTDGQTYNSITIYDTNPNNMYAVSIMPSNGIPQCCDQYLDGIDKGHCTMNIGTCGSTANLNQGVSIFNLTQQNMIVQTQVPTAAGMTDFTFQVYPGYNNVPTYNFANTLNSPGDTLCLTCNNTTTCIECKKVS